MSGTRARRSTSLSGARFANSDDESVNALYLQIFKDLLKGMLGDPLTIERSTHLIIVIKNWERIADQATNIAEEVLFILEGRSAKHTYLQDHPAE